MFREGHFLLDVIEGNIALTDAASQHAQGFDYLGPKPAQDGRDPTASLGGSGMAALLSAARRHYEYVVIDTPAMLAQADACLLAGAADSCVLVAEWGHTSIGDLKRMRQVSDAVTSRAVGVIINKAPWRSH